MRDYLREVRQVMKEAVERGIDAEGVLPGGLGVRRKAVSYYLHASGHNDSLRSRGPVYAYALAVSEENASGGKIVTAPTCGSCGVLPAVLYHLSTSKGFSDKRILRALATAGLFGSVVKCNASVSGAEVGCQGEVGVACAMAAAAASQLFGGTPARIEYSAEMGLEHHLGLTCDPVCGLVQIPCIERNAYAAARALDSNLYASFSDGRHSVSFDRIVEVMKQTGHDLPSIYKETAQGARRYKIDLKTMTRKYDFLVIGSGIAGMSFALKVASKGKVALICKTTLDEANTALACGGVASVTNLEVDDFEKHINDTMIAGDWLSDPEAVRKVVTEAPGQIRELINWGVDFDKKEDGSFDLHREGGHSEFRILHHADNTGFEIRESLIKAVRSNPDIDIFEHHFAIEIITQHHPGKIVTRRTPDITCYGAYVLDTQTGEVDTFLSRITLIATGGVGAAHQTTTNPLVATGDGIAMVYRAKGTVKDMEFIQFHPTALYHPGDRPNFLITEAMRGYGAVLRNLKGEEFMHKYDPASRSPRATLWPAPSTRR